MNAIVLYVQVIHLLQKKKASFCTETKSLSQRILA